MPPRRCIAIVLLCVVTPALAGPTDADYTRQAERLRSTLGEQFTIVTSPPFVVAGDEAPAMVRRRAAHTVAWATRHLKALYFEKDPPHVITVYLFRDRASYRKHTRQLFDDEPTTPYGYYAPADRALIMNIATGGGTLVHEMVHPFIEANFPDCPAWFNEGLASLYEQSAERHGRIVGLTNWRLTGLQKSIRAGTLDTFQKLTATDTRAFYHMDRGNNYAQARYLCYYLQQHGKLTTFYRQFTANVADDPTGFNTLQRVLEVDDMTAFEQHWRQWVMQLRFDN